MSVSAASVDLVGQEKLGPAGPCERSGKSTGYQTRSNKGHTLMKTFLLLLIWSFHRQTADLIHWGYWFLLWAMVRGLLVVDIKIVCTVCIGCWSKMGCTL